MAASALLAGCGDGDDARGVGGLAGPAAVIACSEHVFWGTVTVTGPEEDGLLVTFEVDEWVHPALGPSAITLAADDPAIQVGAPEWAPGQRILVRDGRDSPLTGYTGPEAESLVTAWETSEPRPGCPDNRY